MNAINQSKRKELLKPFMKHDYDYGGQIYYFANLPLSVLQELIEADLMGDMGPWNDCPGNAAFQVFMHSHPNFTAHGYAIDFKRDDHRITIEGLEGTELSSSDIVDFANAFGAADEFECSNFKARCWYD